MVERPASICLSIVSHGHGSMVGELLFSIAANHVIDPLRDQIIVTLNLPEPEDFLDRGAFLPITVIRNNAPKGFGSNHNAAFAISESDLFCVLNPDLYIGAINLDYMREILSNPSVGAWAPLVKSPAMSIEDSARKFPTPLTLVKRYLLGRRSLDYDVTSLPLEVDWVAGMFVAFRKEVFALLQGFDESYHMYMEDVDICCRLKRMALKVIYDPRVVVVHDARRDSRKKLKYLGWHAMSAARFFFGCYSDSKFVRKSRT